MEQHVTITPAGAQSAGCIGWAFIIAAAGIAGFFGILAFAKGEFTLTVSDIIFLSIAVLLAIAGITLAFGKKATLTFDSVKGKVIITGKKEQKEISFAELKPFNLKLETRKSGSQASTSEDYYYVLENESLDPYNKISESTDPVTAWTTLRKLILITGGTYINSQGEKITKEQLETPLYKWHKALHHQPVPAFPPESQLTVSESENYGFTIRSHFKDLGMIIMGGAFGIVSLIILLSIISAALSTYDIQQRIIIFSIAFIPVAAIIISIRLIIIALFGTKRIEITKDKISFGRKSIDTKSVKRIETIGRTAALYFFSDSHTLQIPRYFCMKQFRTNIKTIAEHCIVHAVYRQ